MQSPVDQVKFRTQIREIINSMIRIDAERDNIKAICDKIKEESEILPKHVRKAAKLIKDSERDSFSIDNETVDFLAELAQPSE